MLNSPLKFTKEKKYIVLECKYRFNWDVVIESRYGVTFSEAEEIANYWHKHKKAAKDEIMIIEVPDIVRK